MDTKMKGMIMAGMMAVSLVLGIFGVLGNEWLDVEADEDDDMGGFSMSYGLNNLAVTYDLTEFMGGMAEGECDAMLEEMDEDKDDGLESECKDDDTLFATMSISDMCSEAEDDLAEAKDDDMSDEYIEESEDAKDDICATATAGTMGTVGIWAGLVCALVATLMFVLPMAGVDAMDAIPDMGKMIVTWGAGALMLIGMLLWYLMLPDTDSETALGLSGYLAGAAMTIGLGAAATGQFIPADE